ncbi:hypothetical protein GCM10027215_02660 [Nocardioides zeae]
MAAENWARRPAPGTEGSPPRSSLEAADAFEDGLDIAAQHRDVTAPGGARHVGEVTGIGASVRATGSAYSEYVP